MTEAAKNQIRIVEFGEITPVQVAQFQSDRIAQRKRDSRNRKGENDSDESRQAELDSESHRKAKSRRLTKDNLHIKHMEKRQALIEKVNQRYPSIFICTDPFQDP
jgi:hypothetical protein